jgi:hypothetical protein
MIIFAEPERFKKDQEDLLASGSRSTHKHVRRPTRGIVLKDDTFATLRVVSNRDHAPVYLVDSGTNRKLSNGAKDYLEQNGKRMTDIYSNFLIQSVQEERMEKAQILETFGEPFVFLFGERARVLNISGVLLNSFDFNWRQEWLENYDNYLRGTRCVENDSLIFLSFDETLVGGYILATSVTEATGEKNFVQFQFQFFVTSYAFFGKVGDPSADPTGNHGILPDKISSSEASIARPELFYPTGSAFNNGKVQSASFFDSLQQGVNTVRSAWKSVQKVVNGTLTTLNQALNGETIRIPNGFEGSLVFDDDPTPFQVHSMEIAESMALNGGGTIKYTTFADNFDEFVGSSDHYGTSITDIGANRTVFEANDPLTRDSGYVAKAREVWLQNGLIPPPPVASTMASFLLRQGLGMAVTGFTAAWRGSSKSSPLAAAANVPFVGSGLAGGIALGGRVAQDFRKG